MSFLAESNISVAQQSVTMVRFSSLWCAIQFQQETDLYYMQACQAQVYNYEATVL